jgi:tetratricopeptide (TPR) repeat protein
MELLVYTPDWRLDVKAWLDEARRHRPDAEFPFLIGTVAGHLLNTISAHDAADHYYREALATCGSSKQALGAALNNVGNNLRSAGRVAEASKFLARALDQAEAIGDRTWLETACRQFQSLPDPLNVAKSQGEKGRVLVFLKRFDEAIDACETAIRSMDSTDQRQGLSILWEILMCALSGAGRVSEASEAEAVAERLRKQYG